MGLMSWLTGTDLEAAQAKSDALDAQNAALTEQKRAAGKVTDQAYAISTQHYADGKLDVAGGVQDAFVQGAQEGLQAELALPGKVVDAVGNASTNLLGGILKGVPWWLWLAGAVALFIYLGGGQIVRAGVGYAGRKIANA